MKRFAPKRMSLAGFLASGFTILGGLSLSLIVVFAFSEPHDTARNTAIVAIVFGAIVYIFVQSLRPPKAPAEKKRWRWPWRRRAKRDGAERRYWKRRKGQTQNQPFGQPELPRPSTFVAAPRKPTDP